MKLSTIKVLAYVIAIVYLCSCKVGYLYRSGSYRVESIQGDTATFTTLKGKYLMPTKGLRIGSKVAIMRTTKKELVNVFPIK